VSSVEPPSSRENCGGGGGVHKLAGRRKAHRRVGAKVKKWFHDDDKDDDEDKQRGEGVREMVEWYKMMCDWTLEEQMLMLSRRGLLEGSTRCFIFFSGTSRPCPPRGCLGERPVSLAVLHTGSHTTLSLPPRHPLHVHSPQTHLHPSPSRPLPATANTTLVGQPPAPPSCLSCSARPPRPRPTPHGAVLPVSRTDPPRRPLRPSGSRSRVVPGGYGAGQLV
jgi:hypothetical protein